MKHYKIIFIVIAGIIGIWLLLWDLIDFLTQGINDGIWNWAIIQHGFPSIATGFCLVLVCSVLGVSVLKG